jgi:ribosomal protein S18 acetylase RimI-like enzyme
MNIRKARVQDVAAIYDLNQQLNHYHIQFDNYWALNDPQIIQEKRRQYFAKQIRRRHAIVLIAEEQETIVGYIHGSLRTIPPMFRIQTIGHLHSAYVMQAYQRKGVGQQLTEALIDWFQSKQIEYIEVSSDINNTLSINAWKKYGFQPAMIKLRLKLPSTIVTN